MRKVKTIKVVVVQPRYPHHLGPVREWRFPAERLEEFKRTLEAAYIAVVQPYPPTKAGRYCRYCRASGSCQTLIEAALQDPLAVVGSCESVEFSPQALGTALKIVEEVEAEILGLKTSLLAQAEQYAKDGRPGSGYGLVSVRGRRGWNTTTQVKDVDILGKTFGFNVMKPPELITPTQAKAKGAPEVLVDALSSKKSSMKLKPVDLEQVASVFGATKPNEGDK